MSPLRTHLFDKVRCNFALLSRSYTDNTTKTIKHSYSYSLPCTQRDHLHRCAHSHSPYQHCTYFSSQCYQTHLLLHFPNFSQSLHSTQNNAKQPAIYQTQYNQENSYPTYPHTTSKDNNTIFPRVDNRPFVIVSPLRLREWCRHRNEYGKYQHWPGSTRVRHAVR
jgi:hypothetical protein